MTTKASTYNVGDLANNRLTAEQQAYATKSVDCTDERVKGTNYYGSTLTLKSRILLNVYFKDITPDMYALVTYTNHYGEAQEIRVDGSEFNKYNDSVYGVPVDELVVADGGQQVTVKVYDSNGNEVASAIDSINSYAARMMASSQDPLFEMVAKFTASAYIYFHGNN